MQLSVKELVKLGPLPSSASRDMAFLEKFDAQLQQIEQPISNEEARALVALFGPDDSFGLAWTLLHVIETAPGWPLRDVLVNAENEWVVRLAQRSGMYD